MSDAGETGGQDPSSARAAIRAADQVSDRRIHEALSAADAAGDLVTHDFADACSLGLWHTGACES